jgi:hypothetical protein
MPGPGLRLLTVGHGTASSGELAGLLQTAGVRLLADVRERAALWSREPVPSVRLARLTRPQAAVSAAWPDAP